MSLPQVKSGSLISGADVKSAPAWLEGEEAWLGGVSAVTDELDDGGGLWFLHLLRQLERQLAHFLFARTH